MSWVTVALLFALAGCTGVNRLDAAVARGQTRWQAACGVRPSPDEWRSVRGLIACGDTLDALGCHRRFENGASRVEVAHNLDHATLDRVVVHELGHELGAAHVPPGRGIMTARVSEGLPRITAWDLAAVGRCPVRRPEPLR